MRRRSKALAVLVAMGALAAAGAVAARVFAQTLVTQAIEQNGCRAQGTDHGVVTLGWTGLSCAGVEMASLDLHLVPPRAELSGVVLDLAALQAQRTPTGSGGAAPTGPTIPARVDDLQLTWKGRPLGGPLHGTLAPTLALDGDGVEVRRTTDPDTAETRVDLVADRTVDHPWFVGHVEVIASCLPRRRSCTARASADGTVDHAMLAARPVAEVQASAELDVAWAGEGDLRWTGRATGLGLSVEAVDARTRLDTGTHHAQLAAAFDLAAVAQALGLAHDGDGGALALAVEVQGPPWQVHLDPEATGALRAPPHAVSAVRAAMRDRIRWVPPADPTGAVQVTGPGTTSWTPLQAAGPFPQAAIATEDAGFDTHPGYDLSAVAEALDAWSAATARGEPSSLRGGSTITQQLAKNLFTGDDRTLRRKVEELQYALALEEVLGKKHIVELYTNIVELGPDTYGIRAGADAWFLKRPSGLSWREAAFLASILRSPRSAWRRLQEGDPSRVPRARVDAILDNLVDGGRLTPDQAARAKADRLVIVPVGP